MSDLSQGHNQISSGTTFYLCELGKFVSFQQELVNIGLSLRNEKSTTINKLKSSSNAR